MHDSYNDFTYDCRCLFPDSIYIYIARYCKYICNHPGVDRISGYPDILHVQCLDLVPLVILQFHVLSKLQDLQDSSINTHPHTTNSWKLTNLKEKNVQIIDKACILISTHYVPSQSSSWKLEMEPHWDEP